MDEFLGERDGISVTDPFALTSNGAAELQRIIKILSQTSNDPDLTITCWSFTWCGSCGLHAADCKCQGKPWSRNFSYDPFHVV